MVKKTWSEQEIKALFSDKSSFDFIDTKIGNAYTFLFKHFLTTKQTYKVDTLIDIFNNYFVVTQGRFIKAI